MALLATTLFSLIGTILGGIWADQSWEGFGAGIQKKMVLL